MCLKQQGNYDISSYLNEKCSISVLFQAFTAYTYGSVLGLVAPFVIKTYDILVQKTGILKHVLSPEILPTFLLVRTYYFLRLITILHIPWKTNNNCWWILAKIFYDQIDDRNYYLRYLYHRIFTPGTKILPNMSLC